MAIIFRKSLTFAGKINQHKKSLRHSRYEGYRTQADPLLRHHNADS